MGLMAGWHFTPIHCDTVVTSVIIGTGHRGRIRKRRDSNLGSDFYSANSLRFFFFSLKPEKKHI
jgi:hypothetical protein